MLLNLIALKEPIGSIKSWIRPSAATSLPGGWLICDGSTVVDSDSPFNGLSLPDLRGRFLRGHASLDNSNFAADSLYFAGGTIPSGGVDSYGNSHSHSMPGHGHSVSSHSHSVSSTPGHQHSTGFTANLVTDGASNQALAFANSLIHNHGLTSLDGAHDHNGSSGSAGWTLDNAATSTSSDGGSIDNRPAYRELLQIIKIK